MCLMCVCGVWCSVCDLFDVCVFVVGGVVGVMCVYGVLCVIGLCACVWCVV